LFFLRRFDQLGLLVRGRRALPMRMAPPVQMVLPVPLGLPVQSCCTQLQLLRE